MIDRNQTFYFYSSPIKYLLPKPRTPSSGNLFYPQFPIKYRH